MLQASCCKIENLKCNEPVSVSGKNSECNSVYILVIYDIVETKKRNNLIKLISAYGIRVQKSCFEAKITKKQYERLIRELSKFPIETDSVRIYKIVGSGQVTVFGEDKYVPQERLMFL